MVYIIIPYAFTLSFDMISSNINSLIVVNFFVFSTDTLPISIVSFYATVPNLAIPTKTSNSFLCVFLIKYCL